MVRIPVRVLVVDDEPDFVELFASRLQEMGEKVVGVSGGWECLKALEKEEFDVVFLDIKMPGMDGLETLKAIKAEYPLVEVILLTGHGSIDTAVEGMKAGAFDYLLKPADYDELIQKLQAARNRRLDQLFRIRQAESVALVRKTGDI